MHHKICIPYIPLFPSKTFSKLVVKGLALSYKEKNLKMVCKWQAPDVGFRWLEPCEQAAFKFIARNPKL